MFGALKERGAPLPHGDPNDMSVLAGSFKRGQIPLSVCGWSSVYGVIM